MPSLSRPHHRFTAQLLVNYNNGRQTGIASTWNQSLTAPSLGGKPYV